MPPRSLLGCCSRWSRSSTRLSERGPTPRPSGALRGLLCGGQQSVWQHIAVHWQAGPYWLLMQVCHHAHPNAAAHAPTPNPHLSACTLPCSTGGYDEPLIARHERQMEAEGTSAGLDGVAPGTASMERTGGGGSEIVPVAEEQVTYNYSQVRSAGS